MTDNFEKESLRIASVADEWFFSYLRLSDRGADFVFLSCGPWFFAGAHALELYLKAAYARKVGAEEAYKLGHKLFELYEAVSGMQGFPLKLRVRPEIPKKANVFAAGNDSIPDSLTQEERMHLMLNAQMYRALQHVVDLKYLGLGGKTMPQGTMAWALCIPDGYMIHVLAAMRRWLSVRSSDHPLDVALDKALAELPALGDYTDLIEH